MLSQQQDIFAKCQVLAKFFSSEDVQQEDANLYIASRGSFNSHQTSTFDLESYFYEALAKKDEKNRVFLILGESGSGKSLFGQSLVQKMAINYKHKDDILPLFISLPALHKHPYQLLPETLKRHGFTPEEIDYLRANQRFFVVLDAYDEIHTTENLYLKNHLDKWQVQVLISCRTSYLTDKGNYKAFFMPFIGERAQSQLFEELYIASFSTKEINEYIQKYIEVKQEEIKEDVKQNKLNEKWTVSIGYKDSIEQIPNLKNLITTPFLLRITMEVLPAIFSEYEEIADKGERIQMTGVKLYDAFMLRWFARQEERLIGLNLHPGGSLQKQFMQFASQLAKMMFEKGLTNVTYEEENDLFVENPTFNEWSVFFSNQFIPMDKNDEKRHQVRIACMKACPIRKEGVNQYGFLHASLIDYFVSRDGFIKAMREDISSAQNSRLEMYSQNSVLSQPVQSTQEEAYLSTDSSLVETNESLASQDNLESVYMPFEELTIKEVLGKGAYGTVSRGFYKFAQVAIKQLNFISDKNLEEFKNEAEIMIRFRHPHIVSLYGVCLQHPHYYIVMEYMSGGSLFAYLKNNSPIPWTIKYQMAKEIGSGIAYLHAKKVVHCDLKSLNIFLDMNQHAKVGDFGMSTHKRKILSDISESRKDKIDETFGTSKGGTYPWMAPELFDDEPRITKAIDVYAYAMVLWELAAETVPFKNFSLQSIARRVYSGDRETIPESTPNFFANLIKQCWTQDAAKRPTMDEVLIFLEKKNKKIAKIQEKEPRNELKSLSNNSVTLFSKESKNSQKITRKRSLRHEVVLPISLAEPSSWVKPSPFHAKPKAQPLPGIHKFLADQQGKFGKN